MEIKGFSVQVELIRSKRKTLCVEIKSDGRVLARAPMRMAESEIEKFIASRIKTIEKHLKKINENNKRLENTEPFTDDDIHKMAQKALKIIPQRVEYYAKLLDVTYGRITIRRQKTKWGSCSSKGNLNFNCLLVMTPPEVLDSVVVHELCHRKYMNHSKDFYAQVYRIFPEYDKYDKWLKENGALLIRRMTKI